MLLIDSASPRMSEWDTLVLMKRGEAGGDDDATTTITSMYQKKKKIPDLNEHI